MGQDLTRSQRRRIRELGGIAYERELSRELAALEGEFARWRRREISAHDLNERIHRFHQGPNRQLFTTYTGSAIELAVAAAIGNGVISEVEAGPDLLEILRGGIELARWRSAEKEDEEDAGEK